MKYNLRPQPTFQPGDMVRYKPCYKGSQTEVCVVLYCINAGMGLKPYSVMNIMGEKCIAFDNELTRIETEEPRT